MYAYKEKAYNEKVRIVFFIIAACAWEIMYA